jgi:hypothetical protein
MARLASSVMRNAFLLSPLMKSFDLSVGEIDIHSFHGFPSCIYHNYDGQ